jgi:dihydrofolate synthase / folylpolyglutamate synthase
MRIQPIKTRILVPPQDDLQEVIKASISKLPERSVLAVASKVVSIWQGRAIAESEVKNKDELIIREADKYIPRDLVPEGWVMHTIKNNTLIPTAGIDQSNAKGYYLLWPSDPYGAAQKLHAWLREEYGVKDVGVLITDSHTIPLRRGTLGISLGFFGFVPLVDYRGTEDLFGRKFVMELLNIADGLAAAATLVMGEGSESTPLALATDVPFVQFSDKPYRPTSPRSAFEIPEKEDLYYPFLKYVPWKDGGGGADIPH